MRFVKLGLTPDVASTQLLSHLVGLQVALDLTLSGRTIDASEAHRIGLVSKIIDHEQLLPASIAVAKTYAENGPETVAAAKQLLYRNLLEDNLATVVRHEAEVRQARYGSFENQEALAAFREKRRPNFRVPPAP
jgi:enoyl-CoA hydratase/carnithine racemase